MNHRIKSYTSNVSIYYIRSLDYDVFFSIYGRRALYTKARIEKKTQGRLQIVCIQTETK